MGWMDTKQAKRWRDETKSFLGLYSSLSNVNRHVPRACEEKRIATPFVGDSEDKFLNSPAFQALRQSVLDFGVLFVDTEFASKRSLEKLGCRQAVASGTIDLVQIGGLTGHVALIQVNYDCRDLHGCVCDKNCAPGKCKLNIIRHEAWEFQSSFKNYGAGIPQEVIDWFRDKSVFKVQFKVQSNVIRTDGAYGDLDRLENLLGIKIPCFVELQNVTLAWYPQTDKASTQRKSSISFLAERLGIKPADKHYEALTGRKIWSVERRKPYQQWVAALRFYDISDVLVPAVFLLQVGLDIVGKEKATCSATNIAPYLRQALMIFKDEPSLAVGRKNIPAGKYCPFKDWYGFDHSNVELSDAGSFPWRPGMKLPSGVEVPGPVIIRNLRQLALQLLMDPFPSCGGLEEIAEPYRPPPHYVNRLDMAREIWTDHPVCEAPVKHSADSTLTPGRFVPIETNAIRRKRRADQLPYQPKRQRLEPNHKFTKPIFYGRCFHCGSSAHTKDVCKDERKCLYPLCSNPGRRHNTRVCDALHEICGVCRFRGHQASCHREFDLVSLLRIAVAWAPAGLFTSLPILSMDQEFWRQPSNEEFSYDPYNRLGSGGFYKKNLA